jgi:hypothetical protein
VGHTTLRPSLGVRKSFAIVFRTSEYHPKFRIVNFYLEAALSSWLLKTDVITPDVAGGTSCLSLDGDEGGDNIVAITSEFDLVAWKSGTRNGGKLKVSVASDSP